jgi:hypothetical protein
MSILMVKKRLADGSECRKCEEATSYLKSRGLWERIDEVVWAAEDDETSPGMVLGQRLGVERAPFFVIADARGETLVTSVLQLVSEHLQTPVTQAERAQAIDADDVGGI